VAGFRLRSSFKAFVKVAAFGNALTAGLMGLAGQYFEAVEADKR
jgi:hypothetical protein